MAQVEIQLKNKQSTALQLGININTNTIMTFSDYIFMLFEIIGQDDVLTGKYNLSEYTKFMTILRDAVVM
jgi:hypothetical protein